MNKVIILLTAVFWSTCRIPAPATTGTEYFLTQRPLALIFVAVDCPVSQQYIPTINRLCEDFPEVTFCALFPERDTPASVREFILTHPVRFKVLRDGNNKWLHLLHPTHTPEVFVLGKNNRILYQGAIDNWYYDLEKFSAPTEYFLRDALNQLRHGDSITIKSTRPAGCRIEQ